MFLYEFENRMMKKSRCLFQVYIFSNILILENFEGKLWRNLKIKRGNFSSEDYGKKRKMENAGISEVCIFTITKNLIF